MFLYIYKVFTFWQKPKTSVFVNLIRHFQFTVSIQSAWNHASLFSHFIFYIPPTPHPPLTAIGPWLRESPPTLLHCTGPHCRAQEAALEQCRSLYVLWTVLLYYIYCKKANYQNFILKMFIHNKPSKKYSYKIWDKLLLSFGNCLKKGERVSYGQHRRGEGDFWHSLKFIKKISCRPY